MACLVKNHHLILKIVERSRSVSKQLSGGIGHLLKKNKVTVFDAYGRLKGRGKSRLKPKTKSRI